jgi:hypothetical protein
MKPPPSHSRFTFPPPREWLSLRERSHPSTDLSLRGFSCHLATSLMVSSRKLLGRTLPRTPRGPSPRPLLRFKTRPRNDANSMFTHCGAGVWFLKPQPLTEPFATHLREWLCYLEDAGLSLPPSPSLVSKIFFAARIQETYGLPYITLVQSRLELMKVV